MGRRTAATPSSPCSTAAPGIDADEAERVFDRFYRGSASRGGAVAGTGLGLAIVDALAGRWGARAALTARPGGGTRAELRFPAAGAPAPVAGRATRPR